MTYYPHGYTASETRKRIASEGADATDVALLLCDILDELRGLRASINPVYGPSPSTGWPKTGGAGGEPNVCK